MKIPKQIQIAGKIYKIKFDPLLNKTSGDYGCIEYNNHIIKIDPNFNLQSQQEAFIHECLHAILNITNTSINTEANVNPMAELLYQVVKQIT
jgi:hypothetical protein